MRKEQEENLAWKTHLRKIEDEEAKIFHDYVGWKIYCHKKRYRQSDRDELIRKFKRRFQTWNCEGKDKELTLGDPEYPKFLITIRFGDFVTPPPSEERYSVIIESQSFGFRKKDMWDHANVLRKILQMLPRGKKELYRVGKQGLVKIDVTEMKYSEDTLIFESNPS